MSKKPWVMTFERIRSYLEHHPRVQKESGRIIRFGLVGAICEAIHYGTYLLLLMVTNANISYTGGYIAGLIWNYVLTTYFTFQKSPSKGNALGFIGSHFINYLMEIGLLNLVLWLDFSEWVAPLLVITIAVPINFLLLHFVYLHKRENSL